MALIKYVKKLDTPNSIANAFNIPTHVATDLLNNPTIKEKLLNNPALFFVIRGLSNGDKLVKDFLEGTNGNDLLNWVTKAGGDVVKKVNSWDKLFKFPQFRKNKEILDSYSRVNRIGPYSSKVQPFEVSNLVRTHPVPRPGNEAAIPNLTTTFSTTGYNLDPNNAIRVIQLPDGSNFIMNGNHRLQAMVDLDQKIVPVNLYTLQQGIGAFGTNNVAKFVEVSRLTGFYNGPPISTTDPDHITALAINWLDSNFPGWQ